MPSSASPMLGRCAVHCFLLLAIALRAVCQSAPAAVDPLKRNLDDICNPQSKTPADQDILSQAGGPTQRKGKRPLPVFTSEKDRDVDPATPGFHRDYIVLVYDAEKHTTAFYDYDNHSDEFSPVLNNGAFLPVLYTKEKFLVRVCNLHPTDTVSISGNSFSLPEQGADIRGTTLATVAALAPTLDTLGSASAAGSPFSPAGVNFGASAPLTSIPISGFTFGAANKDTGYTDAVINVSPEALAFETVSLIRDAQDVVHTIDELNRGDKLNGKLEGSIASLQEQANRLLSELNNAPTDGAGKLGWFNQRLAKTQQLVSELNGLANGVSQASLGPRAVAVRENFESILGVLKQIHQVDEDDKKIDKSKWAPVLAGSSTDTSSASSKSTTGGNTTTITTTDTTSTKTKVDASTEKIISNAKATSTSNSGKNSGGKSPDYICAEIYNRLLSGAFASNESVPADTFTCRAYERYVMRTFLVRFNTKMDEVLTQIATEQPREINDRSAKAFYKAAKSLGDPTSGTNPAKQAMDFSAAALKSEKDAEASLKEATAHQARAGYWQANSDDANRRSLEAKITSLNYQRLITEIDAKLEPVKAAAATAAEKEITFRNELEETEAARIQAVANIQEDAIVVTQSAKLNGELPQAPAQPKNRESSTNQAPDSTAGAKPNDVATPVGNLATEETETKGLAERAAASAPPQVDQTLTQAEANTPIPQSNPSQENKGTGKPPQISTQANAAAAAAAKQDAEKKNQQIAALMKSKKEATQKLNHANVTEQCAIEERDFYKGEADAETASAASAFGKATELFKTASDAANVAYHSANDVAKALGPTDKVASGDALSIAYQWLQASEDIETFHKYLGFRYPQPSQANNSPEPKYGEELAQDNVITAYYEVLKMRSDLTALDKRVSDIFSTLNTYYRNTYVEQTDALPPFTGNAIERVSINVQRNFTPFTITGGATVGGVAAASGAPAGSSAGSAGGAAGSGAGGAGKGGAGIGGAGGSGGAASTGIGGGSAIGTGGAATASATTPAGSPSGSNDITVLLEIHRRATFNMVGGVLLIKVPTSNYAVVAQEPTYTNTGTTTNPAYQEQENCNGGSPTNVGNPVSSLPTTPVGVYYCINATQTGSIQVAGMAGVEWFPWGRDYFPYKRGVDFKTENLKPALLVASSVTSLGSAFFGPNFEPVNGLNFFAGYASAHQQVLPLNASLTTVYQGTGSSDAAPAFTPITKVKWGFSFGVGFDLSVFTQLFSKTASPQLP